jgi:hypothetical protein
MTIFLDILGSWILRGTLMVVMLTVIVNMNDVVYQSNQLAAAKRFVAMADSVLYSDLNEAGYNYSYTAFDWARKNDVQFHGDVNGLGGSETIRYYTALVPGTSPQLYQLYRYVDMENSGYPLLLGSSFSNVEFVYYNSTGNVLSRPVADCSQISAVRINLTAEYVLSNAFVLTKGRSQDTMFVSSSFQVHPVAL